MHVAAIGVGGAGGRIVDRLARDLGTGTDAPLTAVHAIDTDTETLASLGAVPRENRHTVGQFETGGAGTDGDRKLAADIVDEERMEIRRAVEDGIPTTVDAIVVAAGLAGGTGSAVAPALAGGFDRVYEQPVYAVSVLPSESETDDRGRENTARGLTALNDAATAQIVFDNDAWLPAEQSLEAHSDTLNAELVDRLGHLLTVSQETDGAVGERVVDTRDIMGTLDGGGLVSLGYASRSIAAWRGDSSLLDGLKRRVLGDDTDEVERGRAVQRTLSWATRGTLTFESPRSGATRGLLVFRGPPEWLRGDAISKGREWFADRTGIEQLRSGDCPVSGADTLDVLVVLAGIENAPRIEAFSLDSGSSDPNADHAGDEDAPEDSDATEGGDTAGDEQGGERDSEGSGVQSEPDDDGTATGSDAEGGSVDNPPTEVGSVTEDRDNE
ncbi:cell division protein [Halovenus sp. WSH3]|uniref:Tubulin-like protein CetZ n=1 Tax=Halovenus carboxidivorans TaxID=2692199 RepID=A0A6B0T0P5_9EURY|nr:cell division protein [Halovenus carboxidivorans]MXR51614.1 cell division protein [Halovenus carboxidivorans]